MCDGGCSDEHVELKDQVAEVQRTLEFHIADTHESLTTIPRENRRKLDLLVDAIKGPVDSLTGERREDEGLERQVAAITAHAENGGVPAKLQGKDRAVLYSSAIAALSAIVVAIIQLLSHSPTP